MILAPAALQMRHYIGLSVFTEGTPYLSQNGAP
jgi:hypothetical protein